jgi:3-phosphoinositide dependent protein kinase-1
VGEGAFGYVYLARERESQELCAIKVLDQGHIRKNNKIQSVSREKDILMKFKDHPNVIKLETAFKVN